MKGTPSVLHLRVGGLPLLLIAGLGVAALYPLTVSAGNFNSLNVFAIYFVWISLAESWNLAGGYGGLLNLGLVAFFGLGGVVGAVAMARGFSFVASLLVAGLAGALAGVALVPTFRLRSYYFAIATLVVPLIFKPAVEFVTGRSDFAIPQGAVLGPAALYYVGLAISGSVIFGVYLLMRSRAGMALRALGEGEVVSSTIGINVLYFKTLALVLSGVVAAVVGDYYLQVLGTIDTTLFTNADFSLFPIFMVIIGGIATLEGPLIGALVFSVINYEVTSSLPGSTLDTLILSVLIIIVAVLMPKGVASSVRTLVRPKKSQRSREDH